MQLANLTRWLQNISSYSWAWTFRKITLPVYDRMSSAALTSAGLAITGAGTATAKTGAAATLCIVNGILVNIPAATAVPALVGTVLQNNFGGWAVFVDQSGTLTSPFMNQGATLAAMTFPQFPMQKAFLGFIYVNPTTANFVGGTTNLDAANTNAVFVSTTEGIDPYCTIFQPGILAGSE